MNMSGPEAMLIQWPPIFDQRCVDTCSPPAGCPCEVFSKSYEPEGVTGGKLCFPHAQGAFA